MASSSRIRFKAEVERLAEIITGAPSVDVTLDQAPCSPDTAMRRALLMLQNGALEGKRVLLLGDDDSVSIAIGLLGRALRKNDLARAISPGASPWSMPTSGGCRSCAMPPRANNWRSKPSITICAGHCRRACCVRST